MKKANSLKRAKPRTIASLFEDVVRRLSIEKMSYALAGGFAVSLYRAEKRTTEDLDFLILAEDKSALATQRLAERVIKSFAMEPGIARKADLEGGPLVAIKKKSTPPYMVIGRDSKHPDVPGLDFLLPAFPWFSEALERAQNNRIDFGFGPIPTLTVEDILLSKFLACKNVSNRFKDLDDLRSIFSGKKNALDLNYLCAQMLKLHIPLPREVQDEAPAVLKKTSKRIK